jgi:hypothetical protein
MRAQAAGPAVDAAGGSAAALHGARLHPGSGTKRPSPSPRKQRGMGRGVTRAGPGTSWHRKQQAGSLPASFRFALGSAFRSATWRFMPGTGLPEGPLNCSRLRLAF